MKTFIAATKNIYKMEGIKVSKAVVYSMILFWSLALLVSCSDPETTEVTTETPPPTVPIVEEEVETPTEVTPPDNTAEPEFNIIYKDIEPDVKYLDAGELFKLDLNNDYTIEFVIETSISDWGTFISIKSARNNSIMAVAPFYVYVVPLEKDSLIPNTINYTDEIFFAQQGLLSFGGCYEYQTPCAYDWLDIGDKYIGLSFKVAGLKYFGWARVAVDNEAIWTIKDYAYNSVPGMPIFAGQME